MSSAQGMLMQQCQTISLASLQCLLQLSQLAMHLIGDVLELMPHTRCRVPYITADCKHRIRSASLDQSLSGQMTDAVVAKQIDGCNTPLSQN